MYAEAFKHALNMDECHYEANYNLGLLALAKYNLKEAMKDGVYVWYQKSIELYYNLGVAYMYLGKSQEAIAHFQQALSIDNNIWNLIFIWLL